MAKITTSRSEHFYRITLSDPPLNILDIEMMEELLAALSDVETDRPLLVIDAAGDRLFSAGASVADHYPDRVRRMLQVFHDCCRRIHRLGMITVAFVERPAYGGGCELALCCDLVLASDAALFGQPEITLGVYPPVGVYQMSRELPPRAGFELLATGDPISAERAHELGMINAVFPADQFKEKAEAWLERIHRHSISSLWFLKRAYRLAMADDFDTRLAKTERFYLEELMKTPDALEGLTAFMEKRKPNWSKPE
jgi:cyclohexa-1,5-dienecarbonyl-CoA hydratase